MISPKTVWMMAVDVMAALLVATIAGSGAFVRSFKDELFPIQERAEW